MANEDTPIFLLNDTVHIIKCIRNNWLCEKSKILQYKLPSEEKIRYADWKYLEELLESDDEIVKLSPLTKKAVFPKPLERQNVSLVLKVFCDETVAALKVKFPEKGEIGFKIYCRSNTNI